MTPGSLEICPAQCDCTSNDKVVDCSSRGLTEVPSDADVDITEYNLSGNSISKLGARAFSRYTSLSKLDLSNNNISQVDESAFLELAELTVLNLNENSIPDLSQNIFSPLLKASFINLRYNRVSTIQPGLFFMNLELETLLLGHNKLDSTVFSIINAERTLVSLIQLDLAGNTFDSIPYLVFDNMANLVDLSLAGCRIQKVDNNAFVGLGVLEFLDLSNNAILDIRRETYQTLPSASTLGLHDNPIMCSCGTKQVKDWLIFAKAAFQEQVDCTMASGEVIENIQFADLDFLCENTDVTVEPPNLPCGTNVTLTVTAESISSQTVTFKWSVSSDWYSVYHKMVIAYRKYGEPEQEVYQNIIEQDETVEVTGLVAGTDYVACIYDRDCTRRACVDFTTLGEGPTQAPITEPCQELPLALGMTSLAFCIILASVIIFMLLLWHRKCSCVSSPKSKSIELEENEANHQTVASRPVDVTTTDPTNRELPAIPDIYESIPAEVLDTRREQVFDNRSYHKSAAKGASGDETRGKDSPVKFRKGGTPTHPRYVKEPDKAVAKAEANKRNSKKGDTISATSNTIVFRRQNSSDNLKVNTLTQSPKPSPKMSPKPPRSVDIDTDKSLGQKPSPKAVSKTLAPGSPVTSGSNASLGDAYMEPVVGNSEVASGTGNPRLPAGGVGAKLPSVVKKANTAGTPPGSPHLYNEPEEKYMYM